MAKRKEVFYLSEERTCEMLEDSFTFLQKPLLRPISQMDSETQDWARSLIEDAIEALQKYLKS
jgi:hypothetical protein